MISYSALVFTIFWSLMFSKNNKKKLISLSKKWFTLIEMLIVIVIIGILAAALIPRLSSARGRARDVARKADLQQTATAIVSYQIDKWAYPSSSWWPLSSISGDLISAGMSSIPEDPDSSRYFVGIANPATWEYSYVTISKWGLQHNGFVIMAGTETEGWSNRVVGWSVWTITWGTDYNSIHICKTFANWSAWNAGNGSCTYDKTQDQLRYIYLY